MESSINKIHLKGNVGSARILNVAQGSVVRFSLATNEVYKDRNGNVVQETQWHNVVAWSKKGMPDFTLIDKGATVEVEGRMRYVKYTNADGIEKILPEVIATTLLIKMND
jgi:single-strand DNA-binding protein